MPTYVTAYKNKFILAPEKVHHCVCVDVVELGKQKTRYSTEPTEMVELKWQTSDRMEDGRPYLITRKYNMTLGEGSSLLRDLEDWRGRPFTKEELVRFDLDTCIGANCLITLKHKEGERGPMQNVTRIEKIPTGSTLPKLKPMDYTRVPKPVHETDPIPEDNIRDSEEPPF